MKTTRVTITIENEDDDGNTMEPIVVPYENFDRMFLNTSCHIEREYDDVEEKWDFRDTGNRLTTLVIGQGDLDHWRGKPLLSDAIINEETYPQPSGRSVKLADWSCFDPKDKA